MTIISKGANMYKQLILVVTSVLLLGLFALMYSNSDLIYEFF